MPDTTCIVPLCSRSGDHIVPKDPDRRKQWLHAIRRGKNTENHEVWEPTSRYSYVCRSHFKPEDYTTITSHGTTALRRVLKRTAVPSIFHWTREPTVSLEGRQQRYEDRENKRRRLMDARGEAMEHTIFDVDLEVPDVGANESVIMEESADSLPDVMQKQPEDPTFRPAQTQTCQQPMFSIENFRNDDAGVHFYTGLETYVKFVFVLTTLGPAAHCLNYAYCQVTNINVPDQFFLVLMKLRRYTTNFELSRLFNISESTVKNILLTWIMFISKQWKEINLWPPQELVRYFSPTGFKASFPKTRVIVDGTEFPIKRPKNPKSQQATFSTYKNRNTVKVLVGGTPGGLISFLSSSYAGSTSDRQIVERSGLIQICDPKDTIMADKGFNVQDLFATKDVTLHIPTFFKKRNRMKCDTVISDRRLSSKRVHIERLIGLAKTFKILVCPMSATETKMSSEIIFICFMLCNFRKCIIPKNA